MAGEDRTAKDTRERKEEDDRWREETGTKRGQGRKRAEKSAKLIKNEYSFFRDNRAGTEVKCKCDP